MRLAAVAAAIALLAGGQATGAVASSSSRPQVALLAEHAANGDRSALGELVAVTQVDGSRVDLRAALSAGGPAELSRRLRRLEDASSAPLAEVLPAELARERAAAIAEHTGEAPGGDDGQIELPGWLSLPLPLAVAVAIVAVVAGVLIGRGIARRRIVEAPLGALGPAEPSRPRARDLERQADQAERRGDYAAAIRLRFLAGLLRLDELGRVGLRPGLTAAAAARELDSEPLAHLARAYDEIVFGQRRAGSADAERARAGWRSILAEARA